MFAEKNQYRGWRPLLGWLAVAALTGCAANNAPTPIVIGDSYAINSTILGEKREINVWYPRGYAESPRPLTTVYLVDGGLDQDFQHIAGLAQLGAVSWTFEPLLIVGIQTKTRVSDLTAPPSDPRYIETFAEAGGSADFRAFIAEEVIPFVEARYAVGERRALIGESLAGLFVAETFLTTPGLFDDYICVSPSLWWDDRAMVRGAEALLAGHDDAQRHLYLTMADEGGTMRDGLDRLLSALAAKASPALIWRFEDRAQTHTHATIFHPAALAALRWLYANPPYDYGEPSWYLIDGASPQPAVAEP